jgi:acyl-CoA synthetase (AMP-forming)/AMP-acid ligase II
MHNAQFVSPRRDLWSGTPIHELVSAAARAFPDKTALIDGPSGQSVPYAELDRRVRRIAAWLQADGLRAGDTVALWAPNVPPVAAIALAALSLGAVAMPLSPLLTPAEAGPLLTAARVGVVVTIPPLVPAAASLGARRVIVLGEAEGYPGLKTLLAATGEAELATTAPGDLAVILASSGTSGPPKGVRLTHGQIAWAAAAIGESANIAPRDVTLALAPWFHVMGFVVEMVMPLAAGATVVTMPRFDRDQFLELMVRHGVTYTAVPPPLAAMMAGDPTLGDGAFPALELLAVGGAPLSPSLQPALMRRFPNAAIGQGYGLTETASILCSPTRPGSTKPGTVGRPLPETQLRIADPGTGAMLVPGAEGEVQAKGPQILEGYLGDAHDEVFTPDGWFRTGDLGFIDADGNLVITGRLKDVFKVNGMQVSPTEVEEALTGFPGVRDAAVVGRPDVRTGETPVAFVIATAPLDRNALAAHLANCVAPHKHPTRIVEVTELPRTPSGKLLRRLLPDLAEE